VAVVLVAIVGLAMAPKYANAWVLQDIKDNLDGNTVAHPSGLQDGYAALDGPDPIIYWDLEQQYSKVGLVVSTDHYDPAKLWNGEDYFLFDVWATNTPFGVWTEIYPDPLPGFTGGWTGYSQVAEHMENGVLDADDYSINFDLGGAYRYVGVVVKYQIELTGTDPHTPGYAEFDGISVPEPATLILLGTSLVGLGVLGRRKKNS
ncbi:MAG: PEP-CTERM sorting domain-containing protein, partial [Thermodesulfobacteriota bacterium]